jgi:hypothetical protein
MILPSGFTALVEKQLSIYFNILTQTLGMSSALIHRQILLNFKDKWTSIRSDDTCFACLRRRPQYSLPCKHCICENCVQVFGTVSNLDPWLYLVGRCFLCGLATPGIAVKIKPKTATARVLSIDGGGVRGIVPLAFLKILQDLIGLPYPVQNHFDVAYGTSSGQVYFLTPCTA